MRALLFTLAVWLGAPAVARAQPSEADTAAARALFTEGRTLAAREDWPAAADRFRRALGLRPSPAIRFNLAATLVHVGKLVEASEHARTVLREAGPREPARASAEALLREIEPQLVQLTILVEGGAAGVTVLYDGAPLSEARIGVATPADPGAHTLVARRGSVETTREVDLPAGRPAEVTLTFPTEPAPRPPLGPSTEPPAETHEAPAEAFPEVPEPGPGPDEPPARGGSLRWPLVILGGVLVGGGVVVDVAPASARNEKSDFLDFVPLGLYVAGAVVGIVGVLQN